MKYIERERLVLRHVDRGVARIDEELSVRVLLCTTQAFENTLLRVGMKDVHKEKAIRQELVDLEDEIKKRDRGVAQTEPEIMHFVHEEFKAAITFGIRRDSRRKGTFYFIISREDELELVLWKAFGRGTQS